MGIYGGYDDLTTLFNQRLGFCFWLNFCSLWGERIMELINSVTVGAGGATSITFSAIPGTFTDLVLLYSGRATTGIGQPTLNLNGSAASFTNRVLYSDGASMGSYAGTTDLLRVNNSGQTANAFAFSRLYFTNYASGSTKYIRLETTPETNGAGSGFVFNGVSGIQWANNAAITSITLNMSDWAQHSTAYLYGIIKGSGGASAGTP
jgi:hypothetical protein